ncbi:unnamed protein product [Schistosoma margrebowiei]|uniref:Uncharacterized protein n=2 Tax=Schistosoma TaxID=6181 RepID=A0AA84ZC24_9TREM|nr:unnamed protein product [Schistosoma margrebowiei]
MFHQKSTIIIINQYILIIGIVLMVNNQINGLAIHNDGLLLKDLKFTRPCPEKNYQFHNATGNFMCVVPTAKKCFELCQELGCNEWYFMSFVPSGSEEIKKYHRCRCFPEYHMCFYNSVPRRYRDFE